MTKRQKELKELRETFYALIERVETNIDDTNKKINQIIFERDHPAQFKVGDRVKEYLIVNIAPWNLKYNQFEWHYHLFNEITKKRVIMTNEEFLKQINEHV